MSGWGAVATIVGLMAIASVGLGASRWMRHRSFAAARGDWTDADFAASMATLGCAPKVIAVLGRVLGRYYYADLSPRPDDELQSLLRIAPDEREELVEELFRELALPEPNRDAPEQIPELATVADLARYIEERHAALA